MRSFIQEQKLFFVATAASEGTVNLSPKGMDTFRIVGEKTVYWLNLTGSGNETAAHLIEDKRMTLMFCAFKGNPLILRLYGRAKAIHPSDLQWEKYINRFPNIPGARQIIKVSVDLIQTSCGMGVPIFQFKRDRDELYNWAKEKGDEGIKKYWEEKNRYSLDGTPTRIGHSKNIDRSK